jgi:hypothetical protein
MLSLRLQRRSFSAVSEKIQALWLQKTGYLSKHGDGFRDPSPGYAFDYQRTHTKNGEFFFFFNFPRRCVDELTRLSSISSPPPSFACRSGPVAVIPRAPYEFRHDIKYFNRDVRRAPVAKKVVTPEVRHAFVRFRRCFFMANCLRKDFCIPRRPPCLHV